MRDNRILNVESFFGKVLTSLEEDSQPLKNRFFLAQGCLKRTGLAIGSISLAFLILVEGVVRQVLSLIAFLIIIPTKLCTDKLYKGYQNVFGHSFTGMRKGVARALEDLSLVITRKAPNIKSVKESPKIKNSKETRGKSSGKSEHKHDKKSSRHHRPSHTDSIFSDSPPKDPRLVALDAWFAKETSPQKQDAYDRIKQCFERRQDSLNLCFLQLKIFPAFITSLNHLKTLDINGNRFTLRALPAMPHLEKLECRHTLIESMGDLPNVTYLDCSFNLIDRLVLPPKIKTLNCQYNNLEELGDSSTLETLNCEGNEISILGDYPQIQKINCKNNRLDKNSRAAGYRDRLGREAFTYDDNPICLFEQRTAE